MKSEQQGDTVSLCMIDDMSGTKRTRPFTDKRPCDDNGPHVNSNFLAHVLTDDHAEHV